MYRKPENGALGDITPFFWDKTYHLFYMKKPIPDVSNTGQNYKGCSFGHIASLDLVNWEELPVAIEPGTTEDAPDKNCQTGSIIEKDGTFHFFYTGGHPKVQTICHATSCDLITWEKNPSNPLFGPDQRWYGPYHWRDPFVFFNEEENCYWMLIAAQDRLPGDNINRGCIGLAKSVDLINWKIFPPFWAPNNSFVSADCPEVFRLGGRWYLNYISREDKYRFAYSLSGPWKRPVKNHVMDTNNCIAGKTVFNGDKHILFPWIADIERQKDMGKFVWGGVLATPRQIEANEDGSLNISCVPQAIDAYNVDAFETKGLSVFEISCGEWKIDKNSITGTAEYRSGLIHWKETPKSYCLSFELTVDNPVCVAGIILRTNGPLERGYQLFFDTSAQRVELRTWYNWDGDRPMAQRDIEIIPDKPIKCEILVDGNVIEAFFNDSI